MAYRGDQQPVHRQPVAVAERDDHRGHGDRYRAGQEQRGRDERANDGPQPGTATAPVPARIAAWRAVNGPTTRSGRLMSEGIRTGRVMTGHLLTVARVDGA